MAVVEEGEMKDVEFLFETRRRVSSKNLGAGREENSPLERLGRVEDQILQTWPPGHCECEVRGKDGSARQSSNEGEREQNRPQQLQRALQLNAKTVQKNYR